MEITGIASKNSFLNDIDSETQSEFLVKTQNTDDALQTLKSFELFVRLRFGDEFVCIPSLSRYGCERFISIFQRPKPEGSTDDETWLGIKYFPSLYIIAFVDEASKKLSLKLITFQGQLLDELRTQSCIDIMNQPNNPFHGDERLNFIQKLEFLKICRGVKMFETDLKKNLQFPSETYFIERFGSNMIVKSKDCKFVIAGEVDGSVCEMCNKFNNEGPKRKSKRGRKKRKMTEPKSENDFVASNGDSLTIDYSQYGDYSLHNQMDLLDFSKIEPESLEDNCGDGCIRNEEGNNFMLGNSSEYRKQGPANDCTTMNPSIMTEDKLQTCALNEHSNVDPYSGNSNVMTGPATSSTSFQSHFDSFSGIERQDSITYKKSSHRKTKKRRHICKYCEHKAEDKASLLLHIQESHDPEKPYSCENCLFKTKDRRALVQHVISLHDKSKSYLCEQCSYTTPSKGRLSCHVKAVHDKAKPFICELCSLALSAKAHLDNHISVVHNKIKPHKCEDCPYRAANERDMARHIKEVHEKVKPYMCNLCPYRAGRKTLLAKHFNKMHNETKLPTRKVKYNKDPNPNSNLGYYRNKPSYQTMDHGTYLMEGSPQNNSLLPTNNHPMFNSVQQA